MANARPVHSKPAEEKPAEETKQPEAPVQVQVQAKKPRVTTMPSGSICEDF